MLKLSEFRSLPLHTLYLFAIAVSRDIAEGEDKGALLERIFDAIAERTP